MTEHSDIATGSGPGLGIHIITRGTHATAAARAAATMLSTDVGGVFQQTDDNTFWFCYAAGTPGAFWKVGKLPTIKCATRVNVALTGATTPDGQTLSNGDIYLAAGQTLPKEQGLYIFNSGGAHARHPAFSVSEQFVAGLMPITQGTYAGLMASYSGPDKPVVGTDALNFSISFSAPQYTLLVPSVLGTNLTGTFNRPTGNFNKVRIWGIGSGGSGGSGRKAAAGTVGCGGGGGGAGGRNFIEYDYASFPTSVTYVVGAGVAGAAAQTTDSTDGNNGTGGNDTTVTGPGGVMLTAQGGNLGNKGTSTTGTHGTGGGGAPNGSSGGDASTTVGGGAGVLAAFNTTQAMTATGGGAGGTATAANTGTLGGLGGGQQAGYVGAASGTAGVANGGDAVAGIAVGCLFGGLGGPGGGGGQSARGGDGAVGMLWGAGGGGGGGARDGQSRSGAGGASAHGVLAFEVY